MSTKLPFPFPFEREVQESLAAALNFDGLLESTTKEPQAALAKRSDTEEAKEMRSWLEVAKGLKVRA